MDDEEVYEMFLQTLTKEEIDVLTGEDDETR
jgi:hypothetical protein